MEEIVQIQKRVKQFILDTSYVSDDQVNTETLIFAQGIMDSMGFISIIEFIEENFSITAADDELLESNFESINAISNFIIRKTQLN